MFYELKTLAGGTVHAALLFALAGSLGQLPSVPDLAVMRERLNTANAELVSYSWIF